jgi:hypothetical protein
LGQEENPVQSLISFVAGLRLGVCDGDHRGFVMKGVLTSKKSQTLRSCGIPP